MNITLLKDAITEIKREIEYSITSAKFGDKNYGDGQKAKEALIRSQKLIQRIHEVTKVSLDQELQTKKIAYSVYPPLGATKPELEISGFIKKKAQDVVVLFGKTPKNEIINDGPLVGETDSVGKDVSENGIIIGVRSQLSSVAKNFDTLMERAFAETLNLKLRLQNAVLGEVYLLPVVEYDDQAMQSNRVVFKNRRIGIEKFIRTFNGITSSHKEDRAIYKYSRTALILVDFRSNPPFLFLKKEDLEKQLGIEVGKIDGFDKISPENFAKDIVNIRLNI